MNPHELKQLTTRIAKLNAERDELRRQVDELSDRFAELTRTVVQLESRIQAETEEIKITEHALLRFCEHVHGIDLKAAGETILSGINKDLVGVTGKSKHPIGFGCRAVMTGKTVVTVTKE